jgi:hypothetical protein
MKFSEISLIVEAIGLKRIQKVHEKNGYIIVSAFREPKRAEEADVQASCNNRANNELRKDLEKNDLPFRQVQGRYKQNGSIINKATEKSFMVFQGKFKNEKELFNLGVAISKKYGQDTFLYYSSKYGPAYYDKNGNKVKEDWAKMNSVEYNNKDAVYSTDLKLGTHNEKKYADANKQSQKNKMFSYVYDEKKDMKR